MLNDPEMEGVVNGMRSGIFITFSGNCKRALTFYQGCFGGTLIFETFGKKLQGYEELPVISGSLVSDSIIIHGSDLVHNEGRRIGNYISVFLKCKSHNERSSLLEKLAIGNYRQTSETEQKLIEGMDAFDVRWVLAI